MPHVCGASTGEAVPTGEVPYARNIAHYTRVEAHIKLSRTRSIATRNWAGNSGSGSSLGRQDRDIPPSSFLFATDGYRLSRLLFAVR